MFSPNAQEFSKLIEYSFIAGVSQDNIMKYINSGDGSNLTAECLLSFPNPGERINPSVLDFVFPLGIKLRYAEETPKFYSIVLTNEKGGRYYIYVLKLYEKIQYVRLSDKINNIKIESEYSETDCIEKKNLYVPVAVCLWSHVYNTDAFKDILHEFYRIITYNNTFVLDSVVLERFRYCELLNYFNFIGNIIKPPNLTNLQLKFHFSNVNIYFSSNFEIPTNGKNTCVQILFDCLEISIIIKLWCAILTEKHIIIMASQNFLLFSICEALLKLIFPFKWLHTYIPLLPLHLHADYIEAPTPYIMGLLSTNFDFNTLKELYPDHVICNVDTSEIHADNVVKLPQVEETKLRKKIQFVKNPEIFDLEEIISQTSSKTMVEDVDPHKSFSENVENIFFRIIRSGLEGFQKKYMSDGVFDQNEFLNDISLNSEDHKQFWDRIIKTIAFEYFVLSNKYLEDSYTKIFKNITKLKLNDDLSQKAFNINLSLQGNTVEKIFRELNQEYKYSFDYEEYKKSEEMYIDILKRANLMKEPKCESIIYDIHGSARKSLGVNYINSADKSPMNLATSDVFSENHGFQRTVARKCSTKYKTEYDMNIFKNLYYMCSRQFNFYDCEISKSNGFFQFSKNLNTLLLTRNKTLLDYGIVREFQKLIEERANRDLENEKNILIKIDETGSEMESDTFSENRSSMKTMSNTNFHFNLNSEPAFDLGSNHDSFQYNLTMAYCLEEFFLCDKTKDLDYISNLINKYYENALTINKKEFKNIRYSQFLDKLDSEKIKRLKEVLICQESACNKKLISIIELKLEKIKIKKEKLSKLSINTKSVTNKDMPRVSATPTESYVKNLNINIEQENISKSSTEKSKFIVKTEDIIKNSNTATNSNKSQLNSNRRPSALTAMSLKLFDNFSSKEQVNCSKNYTKKPSSDSPLQDKGNYSNFLKNMKNVVKGEIKKICEKKKDDSYKNTENNIINTKLITEIEDGKKLEKKESTSVFKKSYKTILSHCCANKILDNMKKPEIEMKTIILNNHFKFNKSARDPFIVIEELSTLILQILEKFENQKTNILSKISSFEEFSSLKDTVSELQKINISKLVNNIEKTCFWLNLFNFLTIFTIFLKCEMLSTQYEWIRFFKNSFYNIGGYELSLFEIKNCILIKKCSTVTIYGEQAKFNSADIKNKLIIEDKNYLVSFAISLPTRTSTRLKYYPPDNFFGEVKSDFFDFINSKITIDYDKLQISIPESLSWVDEKILDSLIECQGDVDGNIIQALQDTSYKKIVSKYSWKMNFKN